MAKLKKYPKRPNAKASVKVWENYTNKCDKIDEDNREIMRLAQRKADLREAATSRGSAAENAAKALRKKKK